MHHEQRRQQVKPRNTSSPLAREELCSATHHCPRSSAAALAADPIELASDDANNEGKETTANHSKQASDCTTQDY
ncbi:hypothetical protein EYF80_036849 [Liparis tanakae]|uniref:Uncharacterized protein n=1 Tax=Liparis tanakae TaxID=230148 RepID=A0A4Z2GI99_9TELE|nr:hypothetical protein EYF80_036849 [Liparis tanakae]